MQQLIQILEGFEANRITDLEKYDWSALSEHDRTEKVSEWAKPLADKIINGGYFKLSDGYCIRIDTLELYYNEEKDGGLKDPIMYHTNDRIPQYVRKVKGDKCPYFTLGSLHLHTSGIDITFENESEEYRASFLIRGFSVFDNISAQPLFKEDCSTKIYDFMFPDGINSENLAKIHWEPFEWGSEFTEPTGRQNVFEYEKDEAGMYKPNNTRTAFIPTKVRCKRKWKFKHK